MNTTYKEWCNIHLPPIRKVLCLFDNANAKLMEEAINTSLEIETIESSERYRLGLEKKLSMEIHPATADKICTILGFLLADEETDAEKIVEKVNAWIGLENTEAGRQATKRVIEEAEKNPLLL